MIDNLLAAIEAAERLTEWSVPEPLARPQGIERLLFSVGRRLGLVFQRPCKKSCVSGGDADNTQLSLTPETDAWKRN